MSCKMEWHHELSFLKLKRERTEEGELDLKQKEQKHVWQQELQRGQAEFRVVSIKTVGIG